MPTIVESDPPNGAIDARQPSDIDGSNAAGWRQVTLTFDGDVTSLNLSSFALTDTAAGSAPSIVGLQHLDANTVRLTLSDSIRPGAWTTITVGSGEYRLGYLPGDVDGNGSANALDLLKLIDAANGTVNLPDYAVDIDRSGGFNGDDLSRLQVLFNGVGDVYRSWLNTSLNSGKKASDPTDRAGDPTDPQEGNGALLNVTLVPATEGPYEPGATVDVNVIVAQVGGTGDIFIRGQQFDTTQTDTNLGLILPLMHEDADIDFWDFSTQVICSILASQCGAQHFIVDDLDDDPFLSITFTGLEEDDETQLIIPGDDSDFRSGLMQVMMPEAEGCYMLDLVNGNETDPNKGFYLVFGFGTEGDPVTTWRVDTGQVSGGVLQMCVGETGMCTIDDDCDDGMFCNGAETCVDGTCQPGTPVDCDDGFACTVDTCNEDTDSCDNTPDDDFCDDGLFCNGSETCDPANGDADGCVGGTAPCSIDDICCEDTDMCAQQCCDNGDCLAGETCQDGICVEGPECTVDEDCDPGEICEDGVCVPGCQDEDCDDGVFCNGAETCDANGQCQDGTPPCDGEICCEDSDTCAAECCDNSDCDAGESCIGGECVIIGDDPKLTLVPDAPCYAWGQMVTIDIELTNGGPVVGGQYFLKYDPDALDFVKADPGDPWTMEIFESVDESEGMIDYATGVEVGSGDSASEGTMATLTFIAQQDFCGGTVVECREGTNPPTRLSLEGGIEVEPLCNAAEIDIFDPDGMNECPDDLVTNADAGGCDAFVCFMLGDGSNGCGGVATGDFCTATAADGSDIPLTDNCGTFPEGVNTITCGGPGSECGGGGLGCEFTITVTGDNTLKSEVQLSPIVDAGPFDRCITWEIFPEDCGDPLVVDATVTFGGPGNLQGHAEYEAKVPCGNYTCATARDKLHTLRGYLEPIEIIEQPVVMPGYDFSRKCFSLVFKGDPAIGGNWLTSGNLNDDCVIDILDFGAFLDQYGADYGTGDTDCSTAPIHADFDGDGDVDDDDYFFVSENFLEINKQNCCGVVAEGCNPPGGGAASPEAVIIDSKGRVLSTPVSTQPLYQRADLNGDGVLNVDDLNLFEEGIRPGPRASSRPREEGRR